MAIGYVGWLMYDYKPKTFYVYIYCGTYPIYEKYTRPVHVGEVIPHADSHVEVIWMSPSLTIDWSHPQQQVWRKYKVRSI